MQGFELKSCRLFAFQLADFVAAVPKFLILHGLACFLLAMTGLFSAGAPKPLSRRAQRAQLFSVSVQSLPSEAKALSMIT